MAFAARCASDINQRDKQDSSFPPTR